MADLPMDRVTPDHPPFINVGVDFFGPFEVKCGRKTVKRYGVIFACLNIRAVHLEVAYSLDIHSCINAIRRFIARRGQVKLMRSDNGTNLVRAERELRDALKELDDVHIKDTLLKRGITWAFNPPQVPTMVAYGRDKSSQSEESSVLFCASKHWMRIHHSSAAYIKAVSAAGELCIGLHDQVTCTPEADQAFIDLKLALQSSRWLRYHTLLLDMPNVTVKRCNVLNPASLLPGPDDGETHNCLAELQVLCSLRPDRSDTPLTNPDLILYVDGSGNRDPLTGLDCVGFAMV
ncbi:hypothetical protein L3Q82_001085 [Scortum barcoo]|uniref:Uncharacterized protein n=1 Tax=Scortum barcoo TaxID=214431 RepID=A0ACB8WAH3_9TELE|nr:hypothetical protein L3Q82_001085 [Scortum barcoo]